ncbi:MAG: DUF2190 family protein [Candidatus Bathyarchaeia archaeon]
MPRHIAEDTNTSNNTGNIVLASLGNNAGIDIELTNNTGTTLNGGECVIIDANYSCKFATSLIETKRRAGIVVQGGDNGSIVRVRILGIADAISGGIINFGDLVRSTADNTGRIVSDNTPTNNCIGIALTSTTGANQPVKILIAGRG